MKTMRSTLELKETETVTAEPAQEKARRSLADDTLSMDTPVSPDAGDDDTQVRQKRRLRPLPMWLRVVVLLVGWVVLLVGVAGLVLPGIQGVLTIILGAAILSVASETAHRWTRQCLQRWPKAHDKVEAFREKIHDKLHRMVHKD
jgi:hypothetical protein